VSEESDAYLARARELLDRGSRIADTLGYFAVSGRDAYMAAFNAAQAVIFARTGRVAKTHSGVRRRSADLRITTRASTRHSRHFWRRGIA
jgi:uncharacterized protein (UPF0332 family)